VFKLEGSVSNQSNQEIKIWPNPYYRGPINIGLPEGINPDQISISISDLKGQSFHFGSNPGSSLEEFLEKLSPGIYLIELVTNDKKFVKKLIKK
jgi:hypothetical protein